MEKSPMDELIARASTAIVNRTVSRNGDKAADPESTAEEEMLAVHRFVTEPAKVSVAVGLTINLGNWESAKINIQLTMPCYKEEVEETAKFVQSWVEKKIEHEKSLIRTFQDKSKKVNPL
jgi:hypothetical protein